MLWRKGTRIQDPSGDWGLSTEVLQEDAERPYTVKWEALYRDQFSFLSRSTVPRMRSSPPQAQAQDS